MPAQQPPLDEQQPLDGPTQQPPLDVPAQQPPLDLPPLDLPPLHLLPQDLPQHVQEQPPVNQPPPVQGPSQVGLNPLVVGPGPMGASLNVATLINQILVEFQRFNGRLDLIEGERRQQLEAETGIRIERSVFPIQNPAAMEQMEERLLDERFFRAMVTLFIF